jgi:cytochrome c553
MRYIFLAFFGLYLFSINIVFAGDIKAGKERYAVNCGNCHGPGGMGLASYPRISGKETPYLIDRLKTYREGKRVGPNSDLMIMMAKPLTDVEIDNLAAYLASDPAGKK